MRLIPWQPPHLKRYNELLSKTADKLTLVAYLWNCSASSCLPDWKQKVWLVQVPVAGVGKPSGRRRKGEEVYIELSNKLDQSLQSQTFSRRGTSLQKWCPLFLCRAPSCCLTAGCLGTINPPRYHHTSKPTEGLIGNESDDSQQWCRSIQLTVISLRHFLGIIVPLRRCQAWTGTLVCFSRSALTLRQTRDR